MTPEFNLIAKYFTRPAATAVLGVGDDCALLPVTPGHQLAVSTDTLVAGTHFFADADARKLGHKALAVHLSDLAAMGAVPRFVTLALTLPAVDERWLAEFSAGFFALADAQQIELVGGDTTRGPLSMTLTVMGEVAQGQALRRDGAHAGDDIWVSGELGGAALALAHMKGEFALAPADFAAVEPRLHTPLPRVALGRALVGVAMAAIDISDGLVADLGHICERSGAQASIEWNLVPIAAPLRNLTDRQRLGLALTGGDDYELCFTAPAAARGQLEALSLSMNLPVTRIGTMKPGEPGVTITAADGNTLSLPAAGFDHFAAN